MTSVWKLVLLGLVVATVGGAGTVAADGLASPVQGYLVLEPPATPEHHCIGEPPIGWLICILL